MKQDTDNSIKRKLSPRTFRFSQQIASSPAIGIDSIPNSPKLPGQDLDKCPTGKNFHKKKPQKLIETQAIELQKLVKRIGDQRNQYHKSGRSQRFKSQDGLKNHLSPQLSPQNQLALKSIIQTTDQFRKDIFENQERKSKASLHAAVAKRQIQYAQKEKQANIAQRNHLKSQNALYQKEIMIVKDNFDRLKRKYQIDLFQCNNQLQQSKNTINELQAFNKDLKTKIDRLSPLEVALTNSESDRHKNSQQYQKLKGEFLATVEKSQATERKYNDLFEGYKRMEVFCQSLQRQIGITKSYLSNTQTMFAQFKEETYRFQQEKLKQLQIRNIALLSKSNEVTLLSKKVQQTTLYLQARDKAINELQSLISEERRKLQTNQLERARLNGQNTILSKRIAELQSQNHMYQQHIKSLSVSYKKQQQQLNSNENQLQNCYKTYQETQKEWAQVLQAELSRINTDYHEKTLELSTQIIEKEEVIRHLMENNAQKQVANQTLLQIVNKKQEQLTKFSRQIMEGIEKQNNLKLQRQRVEQQKLDLEKTILQYEGKVYKLNSKHVLLDEDINANQKRYQQQIFRLKQFGRNKQEIIKKLQGQIKVYNEKLTNILQAKQLDASNYNVLKQITESLEVSLQTEKKRNLLLNQEAINKDNVIGKLREEIDQLNSKIAQNNSNIQHLTNDKNKLILAIQIAEKQDKIKSLSFSQKQHIIDQQKDLLSQSDKFRKDINQKLLQLQSHKKQLLEERQRMFKQKKQKDNIISKLQVERATLMEQLQYLNKQITDLKSAIENIEHERQTLSGIVEAKTKVGQELKKQMIEQDQTLRQVYEQNFNVQKDHYERQLQKVINFNKQLKREVEILSLFKTKCSQLETQVLNLSILLRNQSINLQSERSLNKNNALQINLLRKTLQEMQGNITARFQNQILNTNKHYQNQYAHFTKQLQNSRIQKQNIRRDLQSKSFQLAQSENNNRKLFLELQTIAKDLQLCRGENQTLKRTNQQIHSDRQSIVLQSQKDRRQLQQTVRSTVLLAKKNQQVGDSVSQIDRQLTLLHQLVNNLKQEREFLIKKYVVLANQVRKQGSDPSFGRDIDSIEQHFTQVSSLHNEINKHLSSVRKLFGEVNNISNSKLTYVSDITTK